jgi:DNA-binding MarR family transcriptional regulator
MPNRPSPSRKAAGLRGSPVEASLSGRLDDQLCFALYAAANAMQRAYTPLLAPFGLTYLQYLVLLVLWEADDLSVGEIGRRLYLDSGTLTPVLRRLEGLGFVARRRSIEDERTVRIRLSPAGAALEREVDAVRIALQLKVALDASALADLRENLRSLRRQLTAE